MIRIALCQINPTVGDIAGNSAKIAAGAAMAKNAGADVAVFCELALCGYPPEDLLLKRHFIKRNLDEMKGLAKTIKGIDTIVGFVDRDGKGRLYNAAAWLGSGKIKGVYHKQNLPNYGVFDEKRYFTPGSNSGLFVIKGVKVGVNICEDIWIDGAVYQQQARQGAGLIINISSSPYEAGKLKVRETLLRKRVKHIKCPIIYVNCVGGQDELVFDGGSMCMGVGGTLTARARQFSEDLVVVDLNKDGPKGLVKPAMARLEEIYAALVCGTRDYVRKNGFTKVALGLSGGIDSALVAAIAVDALGKDNVTAISMPSPFNARATRDDARRQAKLLGISFHEIGISAIFKAFLAALKAPFKATAPNTAEENIQARIRGTMLMAFSNKFGWLVLTTGNKSEMAAGYCTLYGDMNGGFAPIKDIFKTKVYDLCRWINERAGREVIVRSIISRAPTAELRPGQTDEASLGKYADLDRVLSAYIEQHIAPSMIAKGGLPLAYIKKTARLVDVNEYKRRQAPPGVKITARSFGKDWRLPITNKYHE